MATISFHEKRVIEDFLDMHGGYVLSFSDRTFQTFIADTTDIDISLEKYYLNGSSKANRLRTFMKLESDYLVGKVLHELHNLKISEASRKEQEIDNVLVSEFVKIAERLRNSNPIESLEAIQANNDDKDFKLLAKIIKESIEKKSA